MPIGLATSQSVNIPDSLLRINFRIGDDRRLMAASLLSQTAIVGNSVRNEDRLLDWKASADFVQNGMLYFAVMFTQH